MPQFFVVTLTLLVAALALRYAELVRGARFGERVRSRLDAWSMFTLRRTARRIRSLGDYLHRDVLLRGLHMAMYLALILVRGVERRLVRTTDFIRSFRKSRTSRVTSEKLRTIHREHERVPKQSDVADK